MEWRLFSSWMGGALLHRPRHPQSFEPIRLPLGLPAAYSKNSFKNL
jgi:hypothetical protein